METVKCCKCERPAELRFSWPWGAVDHCCELDRQTVVNNVAALSGGKAAVRFDSLNPSPTPAPATSSAEADTVPPPARTVLAGEHHETTAQPGAQQLTSSTAHNALAEGTIALVNLTAGGRFMLRRPGQGDVAGGTGELAIVLATLGLIPPLPTAAPPIIQQGTAAQSIPAGAMNALATAGAANRPPPPPQLGPPPPIRPPTAPNPLRRVAGRMGHFPASPQIPPAVAPGGPPTHGDALPLGSEHASPPPALPAPPVQAATAGGEPPTGEPAPNAVVEGETSKQ
jgi:hypothetical protein